MDTIKLPLKIHCDNSSTVLYSNNKFLAAKERVRSKSSCAKRNLIYISSHQ
jgi:hypothetical protein